MTNKDTELLPCPFGMCPTVEDANKIKQRLDDSTMAIGDELTIVRMSGDEKQILRKILWHYRMRVAPIRGEKNDN